MQNFMMILLFCSITMSLIAICYMLLTPLIKKRYSEKGRYYVWLVIIIGFIIPFRPQFENAIFNIDSLERLSVVESVDNEVIDVPALIIGADLIHDSDNQQEAEIVLTPSENVVNNGFGWQFSAYQAVFLIWLLGFVGVLLFHGVKHYRFVKIIRRWSERVVDEGVMSVYNQVATEMNLAHEDVKLYLCPFIGSPMLIGIFRPQILLPTVEIDEDDLYFILKHELIHFRRNDVFYKHLVLVATAIHWFNPVVYFMVRSINVLCEISCDVEVVRDMEPRQRDVYSEAIINVIRHQSKLQTVLSTNFYGGKEDMKKRILSIKDRSVKKWGILILSVVFFLTVGTGFLIAFGNSYDPALEPEPEEIFEVVPTSVAEEESLRESTVAPATEPDVSDLIEIEESEMENPAVEDPTVAENIDDDNDVAVEQVLPVGIWRFMGTYLYESNGEWRLETAFAGSYARYNNDGSFVKFTVNTWPHHISENIVPTEAGEFISTVGTWTAENGFLELHGSRVLNDEIFQQTTSYTIDGDIMTKIDDPYVRRKYIRIDESQININRPQDEPLIDYNLVGTWASLWEDSTAEVNSHTIYKDNGTGIIVNVGRSDFEFNWSIQDGVITKTDRHDRFLYNARYRIEDDILIVTLLSTDTDGEIVEVQDFFYERME